MLPSATVVIIGSPSLSHLLLGIQGRLVLLMFRRIPWGKYYRNLIPSHQIIITVSSVANGNVHIINKQEKRGKGRGHDGLCT